MNIGQPSTTSRRNLPCLFHALTCTVTVVPYHIYHGSHYSPTWTSSAIFRATSTSEVIIIQLWADRLSKTKVGQTLIPDILALLKAFRMFLGWVAQLQSTWHWLKLVYPLISTGQKHQFCLLQRPEYGRTWNTQHMYPSTSQQTIKWSAIHDQLLNPPGKQKNHGPILSHHFSRKMSVSISIDFHSYPFDYRWICLNASFTQHFVLVNQGQSHPIPSWLVVNLPLLKIWLRQLGWWHSQYIEQQKGYKPPTSSGIHNHFHW